MGSPGEDGDKGDPGPPGEKGFKGSRGETVREFKDNLTEVLHQANLVEVTSLAMGWATEVLLPGVRTFLATTTYKSLLKPPSLLSYVYRGLIPQAVKRTESEFFSSPQDPLWP
jgi:hypothetical protein